ncbi:MAG TPA: hypothetical protein V6D25_14950 [Leptolyngbyaceae cyanobacterium]
MSEPLPKSPGCCRSALSLFASICYLMWMYPISISDTITCHQPKQGYVNCQLEHSSLPAFWSNSITKFRLLDIEVETPYNSEGCDISTLYLKTDKGRKRFYYSCDTSQVNIDTNQLNTFLRHNRKSYLQIKQHQQPFLDLIISSTIGIIFLSLLFIPVFVWNWLKKNIQKIIRGIRKR